MIGEIKSAKVLRNGAMLILCKDGNQQGKVIRMNTFNGKAVECTMEYSKKFAKGVIIGIPVSVSVEDVRGNITNASVREVKRLKMNRNGTVCDSLSVMISFDENKLPDKVYVGYLCYAVRPYIPPPLTVDALNVKDLDMWQQYAKESKGVLNVVENMNMANVKRALN